MKTFQCVCGNKIHFENSCCIVCNRALGYLPDVGVLSSLESDQQGLWVALHPAADRGTYRMCGNYETENVCNWMVPVTDPNRFCQSCRLNLVIPNLSDVKNRMSWLRIETAKRRLLYTLLELGLPVLGKDNDHRHGLAFKFLADRPDDIEFMDNVSPDGSVKTGHCDGTITINIAEADPSAREEMREKMNELYRTLLGHFRHEIGHYYWSLLVAGTQWLEPTRELFGDERGDYVQALKQYYADGPSSGWESDYISAYASAHPWEDWAETWAHYMHMIDTLETAHDFGFTIEGREVLSPKVIPGNGSQFAEGTIYHPASFDMLLNNWINLTIAMNALNRSMGLPDAYPFALSAKPSEKLRFIHQLIHSAIK
ncbi:MAG: putative zinc-binding metallopeptidase [Anaerolineae bacterium]